MPVSSSICYVNADLCLSFAMLVCPSVLRDWRSCWTSALSSSIFTCFSSFWWRVSLCACRSAKSVDFSMDDCFYSLSYFVRSSTIVSNSPRWEFCAPRLSSSLLSSSLLFLTACSWSVSSRCSLCTNVLKTAENSLKTVWRPSVSYSTCFKSWDTSASESLNRFFRSTWAYWSSLMWLRTLV